MLYNVQRCGVIHGERCQMHTCILRHDRCMEGWYVICNTVRCQILYLYLLICLYMSVVFFPALLRKRGILKLIRPSVRPSDSPYVISYMVRCQIIYLDIDLLCFMPSAWKIRRGHLVIGSSVRLSSCLSYLFICLNRSVVFFCSGMKDIPGASSNRIVRPSVYLFVRNSFPLYT